MVSKVDQLSTVEVSKKIAIVATLNLGQSIFRGFCCGFFIGFQWENGRIRTKWPQNLQKFPSKSTVDYVADRRSCNSWLFSRKLTILSTMVSKVDRLATVDSRLRGRIVIVATVYVFFETWSIVDLKKKIQRLSTSQKEIPQQSIYRQKSTVDFNAWNQSKIDTCHVCHVYATCLPETSIEN